MVDWFSVFAVLMQARCIARFDGVTIKEDAYEAGSAKAAFCSLLLVLADPAWDVRQILHQVGQTAEFGRVVMGQDEETDSDPEND